MKRLALQVLLLSAAFAVMTVALGWVAVPAVALLWGLVARREERPGLVALLGAGLGWGWLLGWNAAVGEVGELVRVAGGVMALPGLGFVVLTLAFPMVIAWGAAVVGGAVKPKEKRGFAQSVLVVAVGLIAAGCASSGSVRSAPAGPPIVQPGDGYLMYYADATGVRIRSTGSVIDSVLIAGATDIEAKPSPDRSAVAVSYRQGNSTSLVLIDAVSGAVSTVHSAPGRGSYTFVWARGSDALGAAYRPTVGSGSSAVLIADRGGRVRNVGCTASNRFIAWRSGGGGQIVVGDGTNIYAVDAGDCQTLATLPMSGKSHITYSPDGDRIFFKRANSLFIAEYNGANTQQIAAPRSRAENMRWSPDSRKIAFEIRSPRYSNVTHVAVYDYATGQVTFNSEERPLGVPQDNNPCWSPDGTRISIDRTYSRRGEAGDYVQKQKVIMRVPGNDEDVVVEELIRGAVPGERDSCSWVDNRHIALVLADGPRIINVNTKVAYRMPSAARLLYVRVEN